MPRCRLRAAIALSAAAGLAAAAPAQGAPATSTCLASGLGVTPLQGPLLYIDSDLDYRSSYVGYDVTNLGVSERAGLWVRLEQFAGPPAGVDVVGPAGGGATSKPLPVASLAPGDAEPSYAYLTASAETLADQQHDVVVYDGKPGAGGTEVCRETQVVKEVADVIKAAANKVTSSSVSSASPSLGGTFDLTVEGETGTIGSGFADDPNAVRFSPAVGQLWPSSAFRLVGVEHELPLGSSFFDRLGRNGLTSASKDYRVTYRFRVVGPTGAPTPIMPVSNISSGTQVKHTDPASFAALAPIPVVVNHTTLAVTAPAPGSYAAGDTVPVTATLTNAGDGPVDVDALSFTLPDGWTAVPGSAERDGQPIPDPHVDGQALQLVGPFTVLDAGDGASGTSTFTFDLVAVEQAGTLTASGTLDGGTIDATEDADDDAPASVLLSVAPVVTPPSGPDAEAVETSGVGVAPHAKDLLFPAGGSVHLLDAEGGEVDELVVDGVGTYVLDPATGKVTFTPVLGFSGPAPAVSYLVRDAGGATDTATWVATVSKPAPTAAQDVGSEGTGVAPQVRTIVVPEGGSVALLDADGQETDELVVAGVGTYTLDPATGEVTFVPVLGFHGEPDAVPFRITDAYGQADDGVYAPLVLAPPLAPAAPQATSGDPGDPQSHAVTLPAGGHLALLDDGGDPVDELVVAGVGTFTIADDGVSITFVPDPAFTGEAPAVTYAVTDAYGQQTTSTYVAEVRAPDPVEGPVDEPAEEPAPAPVVPAPPVVASPLAAVLDGVAALVPEALGGVLDTEQAAPATCASRRTMRIHWLVPRGTTLRRVSVSVAGKRVQRLPGSARAATVDLRGRPAQQLVVQVMGRTTAGKLVTAQRTYRTCVGRIAHPPLKTLRLLARR